jgi:hypothetical protein
VLRVLREAATTRAQFRGYARRGDAWGRGFIRDPILVGLVGEHAWCDYLRHRGFPTWVDLSLRVTGDGGRDLQVCGLTFQVKTRRKGIAGRSLIKRGDGGHIVPLQCDGFLFAEWNDIEPDTEPRLLGWIWASDVRRLVFERSPITAATHWNVKVRDEQLYPPCRLVDDLIGRRRA